MPIRVSASGPLAAAMSGQQLVEEIEPIVKRRADVVIGRLRAYPPELPNQRYIRTFKLRGGWHKEIQEGRGRVFGAIKNTVFYAPDVQDADYQERIFAGRWRTVQDNQPLAEREMAADIDAALQRLLN